MRFFYVVIKENFKKLGFNFLSFFFLSFLAKYFQELFLKTSLGFLAKPPDFSAYIRAFPCWKKEKRMY